MAVKATGSSVRLTHWFR